MLRQIKRDIVPHRADLINSLSQKCDQSGSKDAIALCIWIFCNAIAFGTDLKIAAII